MFQVLSTPSGPVHVREIHREKLDLPVWWGELVASPSTSPGPLPWTVRLASSSEVRGLRVHEATFPRRELAEAVLRFQRSVLPAVISTFLGYGLSGTVVPTSFLRADGEGRWSAGQLLLGSSLALPTVRETGNRLPASVARSGISNVVSEDPYESAFGPGGTNLLLSYVHAFTEAWSASGLPPRKLGRREVVLAREVGELFVDLAVTGARAVLLAPEVGSGDPIWEWVAQSGLREIWRLESEA